MTQEGTGHRGMSAGVAVKWSSTWGTGSSWHTVHLVSGRQCAMGVAVTDQGVGVTWGQVLGS